MKESEIHFLHFNEVDSTNSLASRYLDEGADEKWMVFSADNQHHGRGQRGTTWQDVPSMNTLMSVLTPTISWPVSKIHGLNIAVCLAIKEALFPYVDIRLKWPNDIILNQQKLGGVLIEPSIRGSFVHRAIVGIGINVWQTEWTSGVEATSLALHMSNAPDPKTLGKRIARKVVDAIIQLESTGKIEIERYLKSCLAFNEWAEYEGKEGRFKAKFIDIDSSGLQVLQLEDGSKRAVDLKEVRLPLNQSFSS